MTPQQLKLSPEALTALNLNGNVAAALSAMPTDGAAITVPSGGVSMSASSSEVVLATPATTASSGHSTTAMPTTASTTVPALSGHSATAAPLATRFTCLGTPIVLHSPFTGLPLPATMQPVNATATATATESSIAEASVCPPLPAQVHSGFHCSNCGAFNPAVCQTGEAYYVVTAGRKVGIFTNWEKVQPLVSGMAHACHKKYRSCTDAEATFVDALTEGKVRVL